MHGFVLCQKYLFTTVMNLQSTLQLWYTIIIIIIIVFSTTHTYMKYQSDTFGAVNKY